MNRVLIFTPIYPPISGGAASYFSNLVNLIPSKYEIFILTFSSPNEPFITTEKGVTVYRILPQVRSLPFPLRAVIVGISAFLFSIYIQFAEGISIIHSHSTSVATPGVAASTYLSGAPLLYDCRDADFPKRLVRFGNVQEWFSCSTNIDDRLKDSGIPANKIRRIPVVNPEYVSDYTVNNKNSKESRVFTIAYIGSIREPKGVDVALNAFAKLHDKHPKTELVFVGDGPAREKLEKRVEGNSYSDSVSFNGAMPHKDALTVLSGADTLVLPSESEGIPRVILEAFELSVPVIASPCGGIPNVVDDGETGLLVKPTAEAVAVGLSRLYESKELRSKLTDNAKAVVECRDWKTVVDRVNETYQQAQH